MQFKQIILPSVSKKRSFGTKSPHKKKISFDPANTPQNLKKSEISFFDYFSRKTQKDTRNNNKNHQITLNKSINLIKYPQKYNCTEYVPIYPNNKMIITNILKKTTHYKIESSSPQTDLTPDKSIADLKEEIEKLTKMNNKLVEGNNSLKQLNKSLLKKKKDLEYCIILNSNLMKSNKKLKNVNHPIRSSLKSSSKMNSNNSKKHCFVQSQPLNNIDIKIYFKKGTFGKQERNDEGCSMSNPNNMEKL